MPGFASTFCQNRIARTARIHDTPPTIFHAEASRAAGDLEMIRESFKKYCETRRGSRPSCKGNSDRCESEIH